jgi:hypothetical protein
LDWQESSSKTGIRRRMIFRRRTVLFMVIELLVNLDNPFVGIHATCLHSSRLDDEEEFSKFQTVKWRQGASPSFNNYNTSSRHDDFLPFHEMDTD